MGKVTSAQLQNSDITANGHGRKLQCLCEEAAMMSCIGRTTGDTPAQPSYRARSNTEPSRLVYVLVGAAFFLPSRAIKYILTGMSLTTSP